VCGASAWIREEKSGGDRYDRCGWTTVEIEFGDRREAWGPIVLADLAGDPPTIWCDIHIDPVDPFRSAIVVVVPTRGIHAGPRCETKPRGVTVLLIERRAQSTSQSTPSQCLSKSARGSRESWESSQPPRDRRSPFRLSLSPSLSLSISLCSNSVPLRYAKGGSDAVLQRLLGTRARNPVRPYARHVPCTHHGRPDSQQEKRWVIFFALLLFLPSPV
jgi:hypothetical protein